EAVGGREGSGGGKVVVLVEHGALERAADRGAAHDAVGYAQIVFALFDASESALEARLRHVHVAAHRLVERTIRSGRRLVDDGVELRLIDDRKVARIDLSVERSAGRTGQRQDGRAAPYVLVDVEEAQHRAGIGGLDLDLAAATRRRIDDRRTRAFRRRGGCAHSTDRRSRTRIDQLEIPQALVVKADDLREIGVDREVLTLVSRVPAGRAVGEAAESAYHRTHVEGLARYGDRISASLAPDRGGGIVAAVERDAGELGRRQPVPIDPQRAAGAEPISHQLEIGDLIYFPIG